MTNFSNRFLSSALALVMIFTSVPFMAGCSSSQALADVERFEPVVVNALVLACTISASPLCGTAQVTIKNDYDNVVRLWTDYNTAVAGTASSSAWNDLNAAFTVFEQDSSTIFAFGLGLNQPEVTAIVASAQVLLAAIEALFPASPVGASSTKMFAKYGAAHTVYNKSWLKNWMLDYNAKVDTAKKAHKSAKLHKVYLHGAFAHYATGGLVK